MTEIKISRTMQTSRMKAPSFPGTDAFSIVELLVVVSIIILTASMMTFRFGGNRPASAVAMVAATIGAAQSQAIASGCTARVAICIDPTAESKYLRYLVALSGTDGTSSAIGWQISSRPQTLPLGTMLFTGYSTMTNTMRLNLANPGGIQDGTTGSLCVYVEFDPAGQTSQSGSQWVFTKGVINDATGSVVVPQPMDRDGFLLRHTGKMAYFYSPAEIAPQP